MTIRPALRAACACLAIAVPSHALAQKTDSIEKCAAPIGTIAINEPEADAVRALSGYNLGSPAGVLRILIQESNCFVVVERGSGLDQMRHERELARSGELQQASNVGGGQMAAADLILTPGVTFSNDNAGGVGGGGYSSTDEGKMIAASFRDNFNAIVRAVRGNPSLVKHAAAPKAGPVFEEGDVLRPKINGVQVLAAPKEGAAVVTTLQRSDDVVYLGVEQDGYLRVLAPAGEGWVRRLVVQK